MTRACPRCSAAIEPGDRFCAECGGRIAAPEPPNTGGWADAAGPLLAARTDPGVIHATNQDAFCLSATPDGGLIVVCDGVSNSQTPEAAALTAARVAHQALADGAAMRDAIIRAHDAVCALPFDRQADLDPPATTIVSARLHPGGITLGWLGDSRAYRIDGTGAALLTRDHSWLELVLQRGDMTQAEASRDRRAHALVHCLGTTDFTRATPCPEPGIIDLPAWHGWLLLCTDGLWNYAASPAALRQAAGEGLAGDAPDLCARLVSVARNAGGRDNITVAAARLPGRHEGA